MTERYEGPYLYVPVQQPGERRRFTIDQIVHIVSALTAKHGRPPTLMDFSMATGTRGMTTAAAQVLHRAIRAGRLSRSPGRHRGIVVTPVDTATTRIR